MHGDYTRDTFGPTRYYGHGFLQAQEHFTRLLSQQGRPITDADWNEQSAQLLEMTRALARTVIGWHGSSDCGFKFDFGVGITDGEQLCHGHYYVDGIRCENHCNRRIDATEFSDWLSNLPNTHSDNSQSVRHHLVYLDVWEQSVAHVEDENLVEPSLAPIDTCNRNRTRWAIRVLKSDLWRVADETDSAEIYNTERNQSEKLSRDLLYQMVDTNLPTYRCLHVKVTGESNGAAFACGPEKKALRDSEANYQSALYRIEIHQGGKSCTKSPDSSQKDSTATFKWSRENGAAVFRLEEEQPGGSIITLAPGQAPTYRLQDGDWIEVLDEYGDPVSRDDAIVRIVQVCDDRLVLEHEVQPKKSFHRDAIAVSESSGNKKPAMRYVRRWFPTRTAVSNDVPTLPSQQHPISVGTKHGAFVERNGWIELEHGINIKFSSEYYQRGDHWLIEVRRDRTSGKIDVLGMKEGLEDDGKRLPLRGVHSYAPLGFFSRKNDQDYGGKSTYRLSFAPPTSGLNGETQYAPCSRSGCTELPEPACDPPQENPRSDGSADDSEPNSNRVAWDRPAAGAEVLSQAGMAALRKYFNTPREILRRIPARFLNATVNYQPLADWLKPALVSQIVGVSFEDFDRRFRMTFDVPEEDRQEYEREARQLLAIAQDFNHMMSTEAGIKNLIA